MRSTVTMLAVLTSFLALGVGADAQSPPGMGSSTGARPELDVTAVRDRMLADRVFARLAASPSLASTEIEVSASGGTVTLEGPVPSQQAHDRAIRIALRTFGVLEVRDQLRIESGRGRATGAANVGDDELARLVAQTLATRAFPGAKAKREWFAGWEVEGAGGNWEFDVDVDAGTVTLEGTVPAPGDIRKAIQAARTVAGTRSVVAELRFLSPPPGLWLGGTLPRDPYADARLWPGWHYPGLAAHPSY